MRCSAVSGDAAKKHLSLRRGAFAGLADFAEKAFDFCRHSFPRSCRKRLVQHPRERKICDGDREIGFCLHVFGNKAVGERNVYGRVAANVRLILRHCVDCSADGIVYAEICDVIPDLDARHLVGAQGVSAEDTQKGGKLRESACDLRIIIAAIGTIAKCLCRIPFSRIMLFRIRRSKGV